MPLTMQRFQMLSCWLGFGRHVTRRHSGEKSEAALLSLSWILVYPVPS